MTYIEWLATKTREEGILGDWANAVTKTLAKISMMTNKQATLTRLWNGMGHLRNSKGIQISFAISSMIYAVEQDGMNDPELHKVLSDIEDMADVELAIMENMGER